MIGKLRGIVDAVEAAHAIIDVNGVGYLVYASTRTLSRLQPGKETVLIIETHVREDHIHLYGFADAAEKEWFGILTTVQGVGVKVALAILSALAPDKLSLAIAAQDKAAFKAVSGIGPKLAERIVVELKSKVGELPNTKPVMGTVTSIKGKNSVAPDLLSDVVSALTNLGYNRTLAYEVAARAIAGQPDAKLDTVLKNCLKELAA